jgi:hypothetical protein
MSKTLRKYGSLIFIGLQRTSTESNRTLMSSISRARIPGGHRNTISVHEASTLVYGNDLPQLPVAPTEPPVVIRRDLRLTVRQKWGYADPEIIPLKPNFSRMSEHTTIHKGFGRFMLEREPANFEEDYHFIHRCPTLCMIS